MRRAARVDDNQWEIVAALRAAGCSVTSLASIGRGFPDIIVGYDGKNYLMEIKDGSKPPSKRRLTPDEQEWHATWRGQVAVVNSVEDAFMVIGFVKNDV